jgi:hypothetical protein
LQNQFAAGQITKEIYEERKTLIEKKYPSKD